MEAQRLSSCPSWAVGGHKHAVIYESTALKNVPLFFSPKAALCQPGCSAVLAIKALHHDPHLAPQRDPVAHFLCCFSRNFRQLFQFISWGGGQSIFLAPFIQIPERRIVLQSAEEVVFCWFVGLLVFFSKTYLNMKLCFRKVILFTVSFLVHLWAEGIY